MSKAWLTGAIIALVAILGIAVSDSRADSPAAVLAVEEPEKGPHGGPLAEWGGHAFHLEFTLNAEKGEVVVYLLDGKKAEKAPPGFDPATLKNMKVRVDKPVSATLAVAYDKARSGEKGIAFAGTDERLKGAKGPYEGRIVGDIGSKSYAGKFPH
jgi:hypothetical protein